MAKQLTHKPDQFQQQAIDSTARGIRIVAPAGSGKSETLARRVAKRIEKDGVDPQEVLVLTFDNTAKKSLEDYFTRLDIDRSVAIHTYDDFAKILLRTLFRDHPSYRLKFVPDRTMIDLVRDIRSEFENKIRQLRLANWDGAGRGREGIFRSIKNEGYAFRQPHERESLKRWLTNEFLELPEIPQEFSGIPQSRVPSEHIYAAGLHLQTDRLIDIVIQYDDKMSANGFGDLIDRKLHIKDLLLANPIKLAELQKRYTEIIVDEAQDISRLDAMLVKLVASGRANVVLAGDDDQTIYRWKNASARFLKDPKLVFGSERQFDLVTLDLNYRSPDAILNPARELISHNSDRIDKFPISALGHHGEVSIIPFRTGSQLQQYLVREIRSEISANRRTQDIAVLAFESSTQSDIEHLLRRSGIPVQSINSDLTLSSPGVRVGNNFRAKGYEWPVVFLAFADDHVIPGKRSQSLVDLESKRREMYVTLTRASHRLVILYTRADEIDNARENLKGDIIWTNGASRFLFEAGLVGQRSVVSKTEPTAIEDIVNSTEAPAIFADPLLAYVSPQTTTTESVRVTETPSKSNTHVRSTQPRSIENNLDQVARDLWHDIEGLLRRIAQQKHMNGDETCSDIVATLHRGGIVEAKWKKRLTRWRIARNHAEHHLFNLNLSSLSRKDYTAYVNELSEMFQLSERYLGSILENPHKSQTGISDRLVTQSRIVELIARHQLSEYGALPVRDYELPSSHSVGETLAFQLHLLLRDLRFYCTHDIRWSSSPLLALYVESVIGNKSEHIKPSLRNRLKILSDQDRSESFDMLNEVLNFECPDPDSKADFLQDSLRVAHDSGNGALSDGVILRTTDFPVTLD